MEIVADIANLSYPDVNYYDWGEVNRSGEVPYLVDNGPVRADGPGGGGPPPGMMPPEELQRMLRVRHVLQMYVTPGFVGFGVAGNMLSCFVLELGSERAQSSTHYILAKLVADTVFLLNLLCVWLTEVGVDMFKMGGWCHFTYFVSNSSNFLSLWYLVAYAVDGLIALVFSSRISTMCTETRAKVVISLLAVVAVPVFLNISLTVEAVNMGPASVCVPMTLFIDAVKYLGRIDMFINSIIPYTAVQFILLWTIIFRICCPARRSPVTVLPSTRTGPNPISYHMNYPLYLLMLGFNLLLRLPTQTFRMYDGMKAMGGVVSTNPMDYAWLQMMDYPYNASFSITPVVLLIGSSSYRSSLVSMCARLPPLIRTLVDKSGPQSGADHIEDTQATCSEQHKQKPKPEAV